MDKEPTIRLAPRYVERTSEIVRPIDARGRPSPWWSRTCATPSAGPEAAEALAEIFFRLTSQRMSPEGVEEMRAILEKQKRPAK